MRMFELNMKLEASAERENRDWHKIRVLASMLLQPHLRKGKRLKPEDLISLPDDVKIPNSMPREERIKDVNRAMKIWKRKHG